MNTADIASVIALVIKANEKYTDKASHLQKDFSGIALRDDYILLKDLLQRYIHEAEKLQTGFQEALAKAIELEAIWVRQELYSERWWQQKRRTLFEAFLQDPKKGLSQWLQTYAEALLAWELVICKKLVSESFPFPTQAVDVLALFRDGTKAIEDETYLQALDMLMYLTQTTLRTQSQSTIDEISQAILLVFMGRINLYKASYREVALNLFERAKELAPKDGLPYAALGSYYQAQQDANGSSQAQQLYQRAIELSPDKPDGYMGMGLLAEDRASWDEATDWYEEAIEAIQEEKDIDVALRKLLAPVSGNLYLQLARTLKKRDSERALQAVECAIALGIKHDGKYPERLGYRLKGEILEDLKKPAEAAEAYYEAGRQFGWRDEYPTAAEIFTRAKELNPNHVPIYWQLADMLRLCSYETTPPYVDEVSIKKSLTFWKEGYEIEPPGSDYSWAYLSRAWISEQLARLPNLSLAEQWTLWWEAIVYLERAIFYKVDALTWAYLAHYYRFVEIESGALEFTSKAIALEPENIPALEERMFILANVGRVDEAEQVVDKLQKMEEAPYLAALKAYVLFYKGSYQRALELLDQYFATAPEEIAYHDVRAYCFLLLDDLLAARKEYEWIYKRCKESKGNENRDSLGWAAYNLDKIDEAIEIFDKLLKEPIGVGNTYRNLGLCYLAQGNMALAEESFNEGIAWANNAREVDDLLNLDIPNLEKFSSRWSNGARHEVIERVKAKIRERRAQLEQGRSLEEDLKKVVEKYPLETGKVNWAGIGALASLTRLYTEEKRWNEAAKTYLLLQGEHFPEARLGLKKCFDGLQAEGDSCLKEGKPRKALEHFTQILTLKLLPEDKTTQAQFYSRLGYVYFEIADSDSARSHFAKAFQLYHENNIVIPGEALGVVCRSLLQDATHYWALDAAWEALADDSGTDETLRVDLAAARNGLANYLEELYQLSEQYVNKSEMLPLVTPIVLEIGDGLIPEDTSQEWSLFKSYIPEMHQRFEDGMGVKITGVRVRGSNILSPEGYIIMLDEAEVERGSVYLGMRYCLASPQAVQALGIDKAAIIETPNPLTGEPGCWVRSDCWDLIASNNFELWAEPLVFIIHHLEAILLRNLANFLGIQEAENLLITWEESDGASSLMASAMPDYRARYHFAQVLRTLVKEQVPITQKKDILEVIQETGLINNDVSQVVRAIRLRLKKFLPGNSPSVQRLELPWEWEDALVSGLGHENGKAFFAAPPIVTQEFLSTIRKAVKSRDWNLLLVTRTAELRPFIRQLVKNEFPHLMVLSQEELLSPDEMTAMDQAGVGQQTKGVTTDAQ